MSLVEIAYENTSRDLNFHLHLFCYDNKLMYEAFEHVRVEYSAGMFRIPLFRHTYKFKNKYFLF